MGKLEELLKEIEQAENVYKSYHIEEVNSSDPFAMGTLSAIQHIKDSVKDKIKEGDEADGFTAQCLTNYVQKIDALEKENTLLRAQLQATITDFYPNYEVGELIDKNELTLKRDTFNAIRKLKRMEKAIKEKVAEINNALIHQMEAVGIIKYENDEMVISYIQETEREVFDSKKFRAEHPDLYDEYVQLKPVKSSVRIKEK